MPRVIVFDVNETLLDLSVLDGPFRAAFGTEQARHDWFAQVLRSALVATITGHYADFGRIGRTALEMTARRRAVTLAPEQIDSIVGGMRTLPPHPEVPDALARLQAAGLRLAALTNSTEEVANTQLRNAGLHHHFDMVLSVDPVRRFKPAAEVYERAANELGVDPGGMRLVAAHAWDVAGAMAAGCRAAFVARPNMVLDPLFEPPDIVGRDLEEVSAAILQVELA